MALDEEMFVPEGVEEDLVADDEVALAEESADLSEPIEEVRTVGLTVDDFPDLSNKSVCDTLQLQIADITDDGVYNLTIITDEVPEEPLGEELPPAAEALGGAIV